MSSTDYYAVLGVSPTSEAVVIKAAFKALMLKYHPDTNRARDASEKAQAINAAYAILGDPEKRAAYDHQREACATSTSRTDDFESRPKPRTGAEGSASKRQTRDMGSSGQEAGLESASEKTALRGKARWNIIALGVVALVILITMANRFPRQEAEAASEEALPSAYDRLVAQMAEADDVNLAPQSTPTEAPPAIADKDVQDGVDHFTTTFKTSGFFGVVAESEGCNSLANKLPSWSSIDRCEAFGAEADKFALSLYLSSGGPGPDSFFGGKLSGKAQSSYQLLGQSEAFGVERTMQIKEAVSRMTSTVHITYGEVSDQLDAAAKAEASARSSETNAQVSPPPN